MAIPYGLNRNMAHVIMIDNLKPLQPFVYLSIEASAIMQERWLVSRGLIETWRIMVIDLGTVMDERIK